MAEKKTSPTFDVIMRNLKSRNFAPIYILMGEESYYIDLIADTSQIMFFPRKNAISIKPSFMERMSTARKSWIWRVDTP